MDLSSGSHIFTHKCNDGLTMIEFILCCIQSLEIFNVLKVSQKIFLKLIGGIVLINTFTLKD